MIDVRKLALDVLTHSRLMSLAIYDHGGLWVSDLQFVVDDDFNIYWASDESARHSVAIKNSPHVAGSVHFNIRDRNENFGLQFTGKATNLSEAFPLTDLYFGKYSYESEDKTRRFFRPGMSWYKLKPDHMELIYAPEFGFEKQQVSLQDSNTPPSTTS